MFPGWLIPGAYYANDKAVTKAIGNSDGLATVIGNGAINFSGVGNSSGLATVIGIAPTKYIRIGKKAIRIKNTNNVVSLKNKVTNITSVTKFRNSIIHLIARLK